jgi:hypothetical protein
MTCNLKSLGAAALLISLSCTLAGCGAKQPDFEKLYPVTGKVQRAGMPVAGGSLKFTANPEKPDFTTNCDVKPDGSFTVTTVRNTDSRGERKAGAPAGDYTVVYNPPNEDQTKGFQPPVTLPVKVTIKAEPNDLTLQLP